MARFRRHEPQVMDSTAIVAYKQCPRYYFQRIVLGFVERNPPQYLGFGSCYHKFRESLDLQWLAIPPDDRKLFIASPDQQVAVFGVALNSALGYWKKKMMRDPVVGDKWDFLTQARLIESCTFAFKHWLKERTEGRIEILAPEQNFIIPMEDGTSIGGKIDLFIRYVNKVWVRDYKTSSKEQNEYYIRTLDPNDQFIRYTHAASSLAGEKVEGVFVEVLHNKKGTKARPKIGPEIHTHMTTRSEKQIDEWLKSEIFIHQQMERNRQEDVWPMHETKQCSFCVFHSVCKKPGEMSKMSKLESEFKVEPWDCTNRDVDQE